MSHSGNKHKRDPVKEEEWIEMQDLKAPHNQSISKKLAQIQGKQYIPPEVSCQDLEYPIISSLPDHQESPTDSSPSKAPVDLSNKKKWTPSLPLMEVTCDYCTVCQRVPANTQLYSCGSCQNINECYPLYGVGVCGCCQRRFGFGFGISQYVKCPKCVSVNRVPLQPKKDYRSVSILERQEMRRSLPGKQEQESQFFFQSEEKH